MFIKRARKLRMLLLTLWEHAAFINNSFLKKLSSTLSSQLGRVFNETCFEIWFIWFMVLDGRYVRQRVADWRKFLSFTETSTIAANQTLH